MDLRTWIDSVGGIEEAAKLLEEKARTVYSWYRQEKAPRHAAALKIVTQTKGLVDYNGIYGPLAQTRALPAPGVENERRC